MVAAHRGKSADSCARRVKGRTDSPRRMPSPGAAFSPSQEVSRYEVDAVHVSFRKLESPREAPAYVPVVLHRTKHPQHQSLPMIQFPILVAYSDHPAQP